MINSRQQEIISQLEAQRLSFNAFTHNQRTRCRAESSVDISVFNRMLDSKATIKSGNTQIAELHKCSLAKQSSINVYSPSHWF